MNIQCQQVPFEQIARLRDLYRHDMNCQVIHDSLHQRPGWTYSYLLNLTDTIAGYGAVALAGPWKENPTIFEFFVLPQFRMQSFALFEELMKVSNAVGIETQSNDPHLTVMLHTYAREVMCESILFHDRLTTSHCIDGAIVRKATPQDAAELARQELDGGAQCLVEFEGTIVATGGILYHYNRPYGDIYMEVAKSLRRRGLGAFLVQELKRICYDGGSIPAARCNAGNVASRKTLQKAGFVPCGNILVGKLVT